MIFLSQAYIAKYMSFFDDKCMPYRLYTEWRIHIQIIPIDFIIHR